MQNAATVLASLASIYPTQHHHKTTLLNTFSWGNAQY
jgi:hypothetical protein